MNERTKIELESGLQKILSEYICLRHTGMVRLAKEVKANIDKIIKEKDLDKDQVYFCFGDPDDPDSEAFCKAYRYMFKANDLFKHTEMLECTKEDAEIMRGLNRNWLILQEIERTKND